MTHTRRELETLLIILTLLPSSCCLSDPDLPRVRSLISQGNLKEARAEARRLLEAEPDNLRVKHLLAFTLAAGEEEGGDLALAVKLGLEIVRSDQVRTGHYCHIIPSPTFQINQIQELLQDIPTTLREKAASLALNAALNTDKSEIIRECAQAICDHQSDYGHQLSDDIISDAATQLAEMLLSAGDMGELDNLLTSGLVKENTLELDLYQYYRCRLKHSRSGDCDHEIFERVLEGLQDCNVMEDVRFLMQRVLRSLDKRPELRSEADVLLDILVELGVFPSPGQRCGWVERGLTSRPVWDLASLGGAGARLRAVEAMWEELR